jgi:hypothetical protein
MFMFLHRMADVAYNTSSFPALLRTLASLLALSNNAQSKHRGDDSSDVQVANDDADDDDPGSGSSQERKEAQERADRDYDERGCASGQWRHDSEPLVLLAYKERDLAERQLWDMMTRETGIVLECVGKQAGAGGLPVEIWLGSLGKRKSMRKR